MAKIIMLIAVILPLLTLLKVSAMPITTVLSLLTAKPVRCLRLLLNVNACKCFIEADENNIGICDGFKKKDWTYGDLKAVYCEQFTSK